MTKERYVTYIAVLTSLFGYIYDFDSAVIASYITTLATEFNVKQEDIGSLITSVLVGGLIGGLISGYLSEKIGRKQTILYSLAEFVLGGVITTLSSNFILFVIGRFLMGVGLGSMFLAGSIYIIELSPSEYRGKNGAINQLLMPFGLVIGFYIVYIINNYFSNSFMGKYNWRFLFFLETLQGAILFFFFLKTPESPRWLFKKGKNEEAIINLRKVLDDDEVAKVVSEVKFNKRVDEIKKIRIKKGIIVVLFLTIIFSFLRQITGINPVIYYAPEIFEELAFRPTSGYYQSVVMGWYEIIGCIITLIFVNKFGRKTLMFLGTLGMIVPLGYIAYALYMGNRGPLGSYAIYIYNLTYTISLGNILTIYISEVIPTSVRALGAAIFYFFDYIFDIVLTQIFPVVSGHSSYFPFVIFFIASVLTLFIIPMIPETRGKSLEEIAEYWKKI